MAAIEEYLKDLKGIEVFFMPNPGNAGDSMINHATYQMFERIGLNYAIINGLEDLTDKILIYGGGGNFVDYYTNASGFISKWHKKASRMILLPHTIYGHRELLKQLGGNVDLICREKVSFQYVRSINTEVNVFLMDDMAFYTDLGGLDLKTPAGFDQPKSIRYLKRLFKSLLKINPWQNETYHVLNCFRKDKESTDIPIPENNIDVPLLFKSSDMSYQGARLSTGKFLNFLNQYDVINTNRLHVCIGGILFKKEVNFYPNSYFKNEALYNHSMAGRYPGVKWRG